MRSFKALPPWYSSFVLLLLAGLTAVAVKDYVATFAWADWAWRLPVGAAGVAFFYIAWRNLLTVTYVIESDEEYVWFRSITATRRMRISDIQHVERPPSPMPDAYRVCSAEAAEGIPYFFRAEAPRIVRYLHERNQAIRIPDLTG